MALHLDFHEIETIKRNERRVEDCCRAVIHKWLLGDHRSPMTWATLVSSLEDADFNNLAKDVREALEPAPAVP